MAKGRIVKSNWAFVPVLILVFLVASEIAWYAPFSQPKASSLQIDSVSSTSNTVTVSFDLSAGSATSATVVAMPVQSMPQDLPMYLFYDARYISVGSDWALISRLWEHLEIELKLRGYSGAVTLVDDTGLESVFASKEKSIVVLAYGSFPSNVFSLQKDLVTPWLNSGGTIVWFGWEMGYYAVDRNQKEFYHGMSNQLYFGGIKRLGMDNYIRLTGGASAYSVGTDSSFLSQVLDIRYNLARCGLLSDKVASADGLVLGKMGEVEGSILSGSKASVAAVHVGEGTVVTFGYFIGDYDQAGDRNDPSSFYSIARDVSQILCSGILQKSSSEQPWYQRYHLAGGETKQGGFTIPTGSDVRGVMVYGYNSIDSTGLLFFRKYIPLD